VQVGEQAATGKKKQTINMCSSRWGKETAINLNRGRWHWLAAALIKEKETINQCGK